jgi:hypothetical protein
VGNVGLGHYRQPTTISIAQSLNGMQYINKSAYSATKEKIGKLGANVQAPSLSSLEKQLLMIRRFSSWNIWALDI